MKTMTDGMTAVGTLPLMVDLRTVSNGNHQLQLEQVQHQYGGVALIHTVVHTMVTTLVWSHQFSIFPQQHQLS